MKTYGNKTIASVGKCLIASDHRVGYSLHNGEGVTYTERELTDDAVMRPDGSVSYGGVFNIKPGEDLKKRLVAQIWSNDDQIAIMLNKDRSESDLDMFNFMQEWREYFGEVAKRINNTVNNKD